MRQLKFSESIREALDQALERDPFVYTIGLGVPDPKGIFGSTLDLQQKYGPKRVLDMPCSENAMTGIVIGSAIEGFKPIISHQRADFFFLGLDQLINNAAKWHFMFDGQMQVPMVNRLIIGRGWGQGPQHSQNLAATLAHFPGLKVIAPSTPQDMKGMLLAAIEDPNPVVIFEHRWLYNHFGFVSSDYFTSSLDQACVTREGKDVTIISYTYGAIEALKAAHKLLSYGIEAEVVDLRSLLPIDQNTLVQSVQKTKRLCVFDLDWQPMGISSEIFSLIFVQGVKLDCKPLRIHLPFSYVPTSWKLSNHYYPTSQTIVSKILHMFGLSPKKEDLLDLDEKPLDVPDKEFTGPF